MLTVIPRRPIRSALWAATTALTLLASTSGFAQAERANLVPANAAYVVQVPSTTELWNAWKNNALYQSFRRLMDEPEFKSQTEGFGREVKTIEDALGFKLDGQTLSEVFSDATVYIAPGENVGEASVGFAMGISDKERLQKLIDLAEKAAASAVQEQPSDEETTGTDAAEDDDATTTPSPITAEEYKGVSFKRFSAGEDSEFYYAVAGDIFIGAGSREELTALIDRTKDGKGGLGADANYKKVIAALAQNAGEVYFYNNAKSALELQQTQPGMDQFRELFRKIAPIDYSATSLNIEPRQIASYSYGPLVEGQGSQLLQKNPGKAPLTVAKYASSGALLVFATSLLDSNLYYELAQQAIGASGTDAEAFEQQLQGLESTLGFSVKNDLVPALGNEFGLMINSFKFSGTTPAVEGIVAFKIADKTKLAKVTAGIDKLAAQMSGAAAGSTDDEKKTPAADAGGLKTTKVGDATVKTMEIPGQAAYSPGYAVDGDYFLIGTSLEAMRNAIQIRQNPDKGLAASDTFKKLAPKVSLEANSFQYFNFEGIWDTVRLLTAFAGENAEQAAKIVDALRVLQVLGASSSVQDNAMVTNGMLLLNEPGAAPADGETQEAAKSTTSGESQ